MKKTKACVRIGTSNIVVPGNKKTFPASFQDKSRLNYYSSLFNTLEINSSFYKIPMFSTYEKWAADVPKDFQFSIKLTKEITHPKNLVSDFTFLEKFMKTAAGIGEKKGCLLIQFPGKITVEYFKQVEEIMQELSNIDPDNEWKKAIEFRSDTWYISETYELMNEYNAAIVLHDISKGKKLDVSTKAKFIYIRYHGPNGDYRDSYTDNFLSAQAKQIKKWIKEGKDVYGYFNNTIGSAFDNARALAEMVGK